MTNLGTFNEGLILIALAFVAAVLGTILHIPWLTAIAPVLFTAGLAYVGGGAAGKAQMLAKLKRNALVSRRITVYPENLDHAVEVQVTASNLRMWVK